MSFAGRQDITQKPTAQRVQNQNQDSRLTLAYSERS